MAGVTAIVPRYKFTDSLGLPLASGSVAIYSTGSTTPLPSYQDQALTILNPNPVPLDASGSALIWLDSTKVYRWHLRDQFGATVPGWPLDNIRGPSDDSTLSLTFARLADLSDGTDGSKGVALIGGATRVVKSILELRALPKTGAKNVQVSGYYAPGDGGGGLYYYDSTDTTSVDNGGTVIVAADSGRWKLANTPIVTIEQFGAKAVAGFDNKNFINNALSSGVGQVRIPGKSFGVSGSIIVPANIKLVGDGVKSTLYPTATTEAIVTLAGTLSEIFGVQITNASALGSIGVLVNSDFWGRVQNCFITNMKRSIQLSSLGKAAQNCFVLDNTLLSQDFGVFIFDDARNTIIRDNFIQGGTCIWYQKLTQQNEGTSIIGNKLLATNTADANSGYGIALTASYLEIHVTSNIIDQVAKNGIYVPAINGSGTYRYLKLIGNWITGTTGCVRIIGPASGTIIQGNTILGSNGIGLSVDQSTGSPPSDFSVSDNKFFNNIQGDYYLNNLLYSNFTGNTFNSTIAGSELSTSQNSWTGNTFTNKPAAVSSISRYRSNTGYVTQSSGQATIPVGATNTAIIPHNLSVTPATKNFRLLLEIIPSSSIGDLCVGGVDATRFVIFCRTAPVGTPVVVNWTVEVVN